MNNSLGYPSLPMLLANSSLPTQRQIRVRCSFVLNKIHAISKSSGGDLICLRTISLPYYPFLSLTISLNSSILA